ncbi:hypothetical protein E2320_013056 [Naja naja]|nr:hypothetical protein E2320_013056 [Naja naja]
MDPPRLRFRPPFFTGCLLLLPLLLNGLVVFQTYAVDLEVKDVANLSCLFAKWMVKFSISYEGTDESKTSTFMLPEDLSYIGTSCGNETSGPVLSIEFGDGNSWSIHFTNTKDTYQGAITFVYNTGDSVFFPDAKRKVPLNTAFICDTEDTVKSGDVTQTFQSVTLQAFLQDGRLSSQKTLCDNDMTASTVPAATKSIVLATDTSTSESNATETPSSPTIQPEEKPASGSYTVKSGPVTCILANMGLQLNVTQQTPMITNFNPNNTVASASNHTLNNWETTMGNSYLCRKEQSILVSPGYKINIFDLKIQPFEVEEGQFSAAEDCIPAGDNFFVPLVMAAALVGLVWLVVMAYCTKIRHRAGYRQI